MAESPSPPALREFLEVGVEGWTPGRESQPGRRDPALMESRETPTLFSLDTARVWWPPSFSCVLWSFLNSREAPDKCIREHPREGQPGIGRKARAGVATDQSLACEAWKGTRIGLSTWLDPTEISETMGHAVLRPLQFLELGHFS